MDIKGALNAFIPPALRAKKAEKTIKSESSTDRDANGQQQRGSQEQHHEPMTEEQFKKAIETLKSFPAIKERGLIVELKESEGKKFIFLSEPDGKVIRRIPEDELWTLPQFTEGQGNQKGQLLRKTA